MSDTEPSLLEVLTEQILSDRMSVDDARRIVIRRGYYRAQRQLARALYGEEKPMETIAYGLIVGCSLICAKSTKLMCGTLCGL